ncbi:MAG: hypothetical protein FWE80_04735 [Oscillospiraceae bacterium]|nr:hypothetical protein [Oscillospiraceae bacterium]
MDTGTFRTALNGFNKQDVLNHIEDLQQEQQKTVTKLNEDLAKSNEQLAVSLKIAHATKKQATDLLEHVSQIENENTRLQAQLAEQSADPAEAAGLRARVEEESALRLELQRETEALRRRGDELLAEIQQLKNDVSPAENDGRTDEHIRTLAGELNELRVRYQAQSSELEALRGRQTVADAALAAELEEQRGRNQMLRSEMELLRSQLAASEAALQQGAVGIPDTVTEDLRNRNQALLAETETLRTQLAAAESQKFVREALAAEIQELRARNDLLSEEILNSRARIDAQAGEVTALQKQNDTLLAEMHAFRERDNADLLKLRRENADLTQEITRIRQLQVENDIQYKTNLAAAEALVRTNEKRLAELEKSNKNYSELIGDVGAFIADIRRIGQRYLNDAQLQARNSITAADNTVEAIEQYLAVSKEELANAKQVFSEAVVKDEARIEKLLHMLTPPVGAPTDPPEAAGPETAEAPQSGAEPVPQEMVALTAPITERLNFSGSDDLADQPEGVDS